MIKALKNHEMERSPSPEQATPTHIDSIDSDERHALLKQDEKDVDCKVAVKVFEQPEHSMIGWVAMILLILQSTAYIIVLRISRSVPGPKYLGSAVGTFV